MSMTSQALPQTSGERRLVRAQAVSGLLFGTFLVLHLANTMVGALGQRAYDSFQETARLYYQWPLIEVVAIGAAGVTHIAIGATRAQRRRAARAARTSSSPWIPDPAWLRLHRAAGWFLVVVIAGHFAATRGPGLFLDLPAEFSYLTFGLGAWPLLMDPYYFLLFACGTFHLIHGSLVALGALGLRTNPPGAAWTRIAIGAALCLGVLAILAMGGITADVDMTGADRFRAFYEEYVSFMATWR